MRKTLIALTAVAAFATMPHTAAMAQTSGTKIAKTNSSCPSGFKSSGSSCVSTGGLEAIQKVGSSCPATFKSSNGYCVATKRGAHATIKNGSCPSGMKTSNNKYCIK